MVDEINSKSKAIVNLAKELLDDIELTRLSTESLLMKAMRLARWVDSVKIQKWLVCEIAGYSRDDPISLEYMGIMRRWTDYMLEEGYWSPLAQIEASIAAAKLQMQTLKIPDVSYSSSNHAVYNDDISTLNAPVNAVIKKGDELRKLLGQLGGIRSRVIAYAYLFVESVYHEKMFSGLSESIFERYKSRIDVLIAEHAGDVLQKIPSVYNRLAEGDQEAVSHAQTSCRRIIDAFADAVYPPTGESIDVGGRSVRLDASNPRARINQYIHGKTSSKSRRDKLRQTLANLYDRVSTGVHNDVTPEEAQSIFLQTYLFLGEVLTRGEPPDRTTVQSDFTSPETTDASVV